MYSIKNSLIEYLYNLNLPHIKECLLKFFPNFKSFPNLIKGIKDPNSNIECFDNDFCYAELSKNPIINIKDKNSKSLKLLVRKEYLKEDLKGIFGQLKNLTSLDLLLDDVNDYFFDFISQFMKNIKRLSIFNYNDSKFLSSISNNITELTLENIKLVENDFKILEGNKTLRCIYLYHMDYISNENLLRILSNKDLKRINIPFLPFSLNRNIHTKGITNMGIELFTQSENYLKFKSLKVLKIKIDLDSKISLIKSIFGSIEILDLEIHDYSIWEQLQKLLLGYKSIWNLRLDNKTDNKFLKISNITKFLKNFKIVKLFNFSLDLTRMARNDNLKELILMYPKKAHLIGESDVEFFFEKCKNLKILQICNKSMDKFYFKKYFKK